METFLYAIILTGIIFGLMYMCISMARQSKDDDKAYLYLAGFFSFCIVAFFMYRENMFQTEIRETKELLDETMKESYEVIECVQEIGSDARKTAYKYNTTEYDVEELVSAIEYEFLEVSSKCEYICENCEIDFELMDSEIGKNESRDNSLQKDKEKSKQSGKAEKDDSASEPGTKTELVLRAIVIGNETPVSIYTENSTCFSKVMYVSSKEILIVMFRNSGNEYAYYGVSKSVWNEFCDAESMGKYYNDYIKNEYDCVKLY